MAFHVEYSRTDRLLHRLAFAAPSVQLAAAEMEESLYGAALRGIAAGRPVFVTSLARAGTTMVLELLHRLPEFASTTYRDMPFVLAPMLWARVSGRFRRQAGLRERAHGDGVAIGYDSPEGFEEVFWKAFWPGHYRGERIGHWQAADVNAEATEFLGRHMRKIIALRRPGQPGARYLSKNNTNIARLALLPRMFPDARILVILREPLEHARSLHRQHANFVDLQREPFAARYMDDIGHYEFGALHRPIDFPGLEALIGGRGPASPDYWLAYWIAAFEHVAAHRNGVRVSSYEALCAGGTAVFEGLAAALGLEGGTALVQAASHLRPARRLADPADFDPALRARAEALHGALAEGAEVAG
ncbi:MAG TPA: sulfotransferase [Paracoccaceae bacterium]|nr:sulfotransferase [Paracoccaceae bacterium]